MTVLPGRRLLVALALAAAGTLALGTTVVTAPDAGATVGRRAELKVKAAVKAAAERARRAVRVRADDGVRLTTSPTVSPVADGFIVSANAGGVFVWRWWTPDAGMSPWVEMAGPQISGRPVVVWNPIVEHLEFFFNLDGRLHRFVVNAHDEYESQDFGAASDADPVAFLNPGNGNLQVYATHDGVLSERYMSRSGRAWSGWGSLDSSGMKGEVAPFYNPGNKNVQLYANLDGTLAEKWWNAETGQWSGWNRFEGAISGTPVAFHNPGNRNTEVYVNRGGDLGEKWWRASDGRWMPWAGFGGDLTGRPAVFYNPVNRNVELYGNSNGKLVEKYWRSSDGAWLGWYEFPGTIVGEPAVLYDRSSSFVRIFAVDTEGRLVENYWRSGAPWSGWTAL